MTGVEIEYFLGLYFLIASMTFANGKFSADAFRLIVGIILIVLAIVGYSPIH